MAKVVIIGQENEHAPDPLDLIVCATENLETCHQINGAALDDNFYQGFTVQVLKVCRIPGPTACLKLLQKVHLKKWRKEKISMTGPGRAASNL